ncbi:glycosyltransferase family 4 protein [Flavisolibacter sp. BT320]|nr:glycosyltransferase family 4 protein [Flavisolibacter longurius]
MHTKKTKVTFLTNIPAPYREPMHEILAQSSGIDYSVIYCSKIEPNREWKFERGNYERWYLKEKATSMMHNNPNVFKYLQQIRPDVVVATGFYPTSLYGFLWCLVNRKKFIPLTDGTLRSEKDLSFVHRLVRKVVYKFSDSYVGASTGSVDLYRSYNVPETQIFRCHLCIENSPFLSVKPETKEFDLMFSGQMIERKMPLFFAEVARLVKEKLGKCKVLVLGNGPLKETMLKKLKEYNIEFEYPGFVQPHNLPAFYKKAKVFLFPTLQDPWGIVANEACAAGVPVITCENAGVAGDLIIHNKNGYVLPLEEVTWAEKTCHLLTNENDRQLFSENAVNAVKAYNPQAASKGVLDAVYFSLTN